MIVEHPMFDPAANDNDFLNNAVSNGFTDTVKILLADPRVDPSIWEKHAIKSAFEYNSIEIISLLLKDERVFSAINSLVQQL